MFRINQGQFYSREGFHPGNIIKRMGILQLLFYFIVSALLLLIGTINGSVYSLQLLFDSRTLSFGFGEGYIPIVSFILSSFPGAFMVSWVVKRAKKCLDYVSTIYIIHLALCWLNYHFPSNWDWWVVNFCSFLIMAVLSEYLCIRKEMNPIRLDHTLHLDDLSDDSDTDNDDKPLLKSKGDPDRDHNSKSRIQHDDQSFEVKIV